MRIRRYLLVGGSVFIFELLVIVVAQWLGAKPILAVGISFCLGTLMSFLLQKVVTFGDRRLHHKIIVPQLIATCVLVLCNFGFTLLVTQLLTPPPTGYRQPNYIFISNHYLEFLFVQNSYFQVG
jgi:putative flippase GtrA